MVLYHFEGRGFRFFDLELIYIIFYTLNPYSLSFKILWQKEQLIINNIIVGIIE